MKKIFMIILLTTITNANAFILKAGEGAHLIGVRDPSTLKEKVEYLDDNGNPQTGWAEIVSSCKHLGMDPERELEKIKCGTDIDISSVRTLPIASILKTIPTQTTPVTSCDTCNPAKEKEKEKDKPNAFGFKLATYKPRVESPVYATGSQYFANGIDLFFDRANSAKVDGFKFSTTNSKKVLEDASRSYLFEFNDQALSDSQLYVEEAASSRPSENSQSVVVFLPRKNLPSFEQKGNNLVVTLSNGEEVIFDKETKDIVGGVLEVGKMTVGPKNKTTPIDLKYSGNGVMIKSDTVGTTHPQDNSKDYLSIYKKGYPVCRKIKSTDVWGMKASTSGGQKGQKNPSVLLVKDDLAGDDAFDKLIKSQCGFSIF